MPCVFCNDPRQAGELVFDDEKLFVLLHPDWAVRGHAMVVWKEHVENVADLDARDYAHFASVHQRAERALLDATGADRAILLKLGIVTPHLHLHVYPVPASLDRAEVMAIIDGKTVDAGSDEERKTFVEDLRCRLS